MTEPRYGSGGAASDPPAGRTYYGKPGTETAAPKRDPFDFASMMIRLNEAQLSIKAAREEHALTANAIQAFENRLTALDAKITEFKAKIEAEQAGTELPQAEQQPAA